jgi:hypothetical protein
MKIFAEICVLKPEHTIKVVETLIEDNCSVVIRANAYDQCNPTIFVVGYGEADIEDDACSTILKPARQDRRRRHRSRRRPPGHHGRGSAADRAAIRDRRIRRERYRAADQLSRILARARVQDGD